MRFMKQINDENFITQNWKRIPRSEAKELNPHAYGVFNYFGNKNGNKTYFYRCKKLKDGKCTVYKYRPKTCRIFKPGNLTYREDCGKGVDT